jgi:hypothetical protein
MNVSNCFAYFLLPASVVPEQMVRSPVTSQGLCDPDTAVVTLIQADLRVTHKFS